jgi:hypothetical protein
MFGAEPAAVTLRVGRYLFRGIVGKSRVSAEALILVARRMFRLQLLEGRFEYVQSRRNVRVAPRRGYFATQHLQVVHDEDGSCGEPNELGIGIVVGPIALVDVSPDHRDRRYSPELRDDVRATDVAAMDNVIRAREKSHRLRPQETVCILFLLDLQPLARISAIVRDRHRIEGAAKPCRFLDGRVDLALADRTADTEARLAIQGQPVADLDRRIAQIDAAKPSSKRLSSNAAPYFPSYSLALVKPA